MVFNEKKTLKVSDISREIRLIEFFLFPSLKATPSVISKFAKSAVLTYYNGVTAYDNLITIGLTGDTSQPYI